MFFKKSTLPDLIKAGKLEKVKKEINSANCNIPDAEGRAPLYYAVKYEKAKTARYLLEQGSTPASGSSSPNTSVMEDVICTFNENLLQVFLEHGEILPDKMEHIPLLHYVVTHKYFYKNLLKTLIDNGVDINLIDTYKTEKTALAYLLSQDDFSLNALKALIEYGVDVNYASSNKFRPLYVALTNHKLPCKATVGDFGFSKVFDLLLQNNLEVNFKINTLSGRSMSLAITALQNCKIESFILLIENGLDINADDLENIEGYLDVNEFSIKQRKRVVEINELRKLNLPLHTSFYGDNLSTKLDEIPKDDPKISSSFTDLVMTSNMSLTKKIPMLEQLLKNGANINNEEKYAGFNMNILTALTCWNEGIDQPIKLMEWLLEKGAKIECYGRSTFLWAIWYNKPDLVRFYGEKGADLLYEEADKSTMLSKIFTISPSHNQYNSSKDRSDMIKLLYELCNAQNISFPIDESFVNGNDAYNLEDSDTLPQSAVYYGGETRREIVHALIACGWDINRKFKCFDANGSLLSQFLSCKKADEEMITFLLDNFPEIEIANAGTIDPLYNAITHNYNPTIIKRFIHASSNINKVIKREFKDEFVLETEGNYLQLTLNMASKLEDKKEDWAYEVSKCLLEADLNPNNTIKQKLSDKYMEGGYYRKELTLLEDTVIFDDLNYFKIFQLLLDYGADPYKPMCYFEETFMHFLMQRSTSSLSQQDKLEYLKELDKRGLLQIESKTNNGGTPLLYAAGKCRVDLVRYLVNKGADVHAVGGFDQSLALHRAISNFAWPSKEDRLETVKILLNAGADIEKIDHDGYSPLMMAAAFGCYTIAEELLKRGANPNHVNEDGKAAVHFAVTEPNCYDEYNNSNDDEERENGMDEALKTKIIQLLLEHKADINIAHHKGGTPLIDAIGYGYRKIFKGMLKMGINANNQDTFGRTPLMIAAKYGDIAFVNILGRQREVQDGVMLLDENGENLLHYLASRTYERTGEFDISKDKEALPLIKTMIENINVPYLKNNSGQTPLHFAALYAMPKVIEYLIAKTDINELDNNNNSALLYALSVDTEEADYEKAIETTKLLIDNGADINVVNGDGQTALSIATNRSMNEVIELLKKAGAKESQPTIGFKQSN